MKEAEKEAERLIDDFAVYDWDESSGYVQSMSESTKMAIKVVSEILHTYSPLNMGFYCDSEHHKGELKFWQEVKTIIENK